MIALPETRRPARELPRAARPFLGRDGRAVLVGIEQPLVSGPVSDLAILPGAIAAAARARPDAVVLHRGPLVAGLWRPHPEVRLVVHLSASSDLQAAGPRAEALTTSVEEAVDLGADAVSASFSAASLQDGTRRALGVLNRLARDCANRRLPLVCVLNGGTGDAQQWRRLAQAARSAERLGVDAVRVCHPGREDWLAWLLDRCGVPVLLGVGARDRRAALELAALAVTAGAAGVVLGRAAYERTDPESLVLAVSAVVHGVAHEPALARSA